MDALPDDPFDKDDISRIEFQEEAELVANLIRGSDEAVENMAELAVAVRNLAETLEGMGLKSIVYLWQFLSVRSVHNGTNDGHED